MVNSMCTLRLDGSLREKEATMKLTLLAAAMLVLCTTPPSQAASVRLAWNPSPGRSVVGYRVHYGLKPGKFTHVVQVTGRLTTKVLIGGLEAGKTYFFAVTALNKRGQESAYSPEISGKPERKTPGSHNRAASASPPASRKLLRAKIAPNRIITRGPTGKILPTR